ncbi:MAG TPA: hypothetical protein VKV40_24760 [Ktedonobacteraceae bacterium]|nr:hypothetical protein [Ktedonobacteraceae bacterium]
MDDISNTGSTGKVNEMNDMDEANCPAHTPPLDLSPFDQVFLRFAPQDIEQFQLLYQRWALQQQINEVQQEIAAVRRELAETVQLVERVHPSAIALATLARLQASGVEDSDLLDRMLERGEEWLDHTIQHLEYCEQLDVIRGDYEEWCRHALEDAFAWLDSMQSDTDLTATTVADPVHLPQVSTSEAETPADEMTEELFLQKLMSEEPATGSEDANTETGDETNEEISSGEPAADTGEAEAVEQLALEETTLKVAAVQPTAEAQDEVGDETIEADLPPSTPGEAPASIPVSSPTSGAEMPDPVVLQTAAVENTSPDTDNSSHTQKGTTGRQSRFLQRFLSALWP